MSEILVRPVSSRNDRKRFLEFPWQLYQGDPNWIPPLRANQRDLAGFGRHPFYEENACQPFLALRGDEVCGRIVSVLNRSHITCCSDRRGFFGFFECIDDQAVADSLFDAAREWLSSEHDIHRLRGPASPSLNYETGLLVDGFDSPPTFMMTYNRPYFARLIENYGFVKAQDLYAYWGSVEMLPKISKKLGSLAEQIIERFEVTLRPLDPSRFQEDVDAFLSLYNRSLMDTWGFVPMTPSELRHLSQGMRHLIVPEMTVLAEIGGELAGVVFGLPDYNPRIRQIDGRLFPFGFLRLIRHKEELKRIRLLSVNVVPEYHRMGLGLALLHELSPRVLEWGIQEAEFSWVLESNHLSRGSLEKGGAILNKTYRLYDLNP